MTSIKTAISLEGPLLQRMLDAGEADLPKRSVVNVSQVFTVDKSDLVERIGCLSELRLREIREGVQLLLEPREPVPIDD